MSAPDPLPPEYLHAFFHPHGIALVGATDKSGWSRNTFDNLKHFGSGPLYCVNPNYQVVHGEPAIRSLHDLPESVDLAFLMVPAAQVYAVALEAADVGIRHLVVLTSGFSELGASGAEREQQLLTLARKRDLILLGPNGNGFINASAQIAPYGLPIAPPLLRGPVGIVLQSGGLANAALTFAQAHAIGISLLVSMGNELMLSATEVVDYLLEDAQTRVIALFLEAIRRPAELRRLAHKALERRKPLVMLKVGRSALGARAALAHTGALVGDDAVNATALQQLGIIRVDSLEDLLITSGLLGYTGLLPGRRMGVITASGGGGELLADRAQEVGIELPAFAPLTIERLQTVLPPFSTAQNPVDVTGYVVVDQLLAQRAMEVVVDDPQLDFVLRLTDPPRIAPANSEPLLALFDLLGQSVHTARCPIIVLAYTCSDLTPFGRMIAERTGIHFVGGIEHGMTALGKALWWTEICRRAVAPRPPEDPPQPIRLEAPPIGVWSEYQARQLLQAQGIPVVPGVLATDAEAAVAAAHQFGMPCALKIQSSALAHKSDVGGVLLQVASEKAVRQGFSTLMERIHTRFPTLAVEGVLVSPMRPAGTELLVGIIRDPLWGLVLAIGLGGIWAEALKDTSLRVLPVDRAEIGAMVRELRGATVLQGTRGHTPANMGALIEVIYQVSQVALGLEAHLEALEINPLLVAEGLIEALDVLVTWRASASRPM